MSSLKVADWLVASFRPITMRETDLRVKYLYKVQGHMLILRVMFANFVNLCCTLFWWPQGYTDIEKTWCQFFIHFLCGFRGNYEMTKIQ